MVAKALSRAIKKATKGKKIKPIWKETKAEGVARLEKKRKAAAAADSKTKKPDLMTSEKAKKMVGTKGGYKTKSKRANATTKGKQSEFERGTAATAKKGSIAKSPIGFNKIKSAAQFTKAQNRLRALANRVGPLTKAERAEVTKLKKLVADYKKMRTAETKAGRKTQLLAADKRRIKPKVSLAPDFKPKRK